MIKQVFYFEVTDTFGGELNYSWLSRYIIKAKNLKGALIKLSKYTNLKFRHNGSYYRAKNECVGAYELDYAIDTNWIEKSEVL